jgi:hypothetical protein
MQRPTQRLVAGPQFWLVSLVLLWLALWTRLASLDRLPVFVDEGTHIQWTRAFVAGTNAYPRLMDGRVGLMAWLALFQLNGPAPLWAARAAGAMAATLSCAACLSLGARFSRRTGLLAGLLYALLPYAVFHDRQALADPLTAAWGALMLALLPRLANGRWTWTLAVGAALAASALIKFTSVTYLAGLLWAALVLPTTNRRRLALKTLGVLSAAAMVAAGVLLALASRLGGETSIFANAQLSFVSCPPVLCAGDVSEQLRRLPDVVSGWLALVPPYFGWPLLAMAVLALLTTHQRRRVVFLWLTVGSMTLAVWLAATQALPPRYYSFLAAPLAVLAAHGIWAAAQWFNRRSARVIVTGALMGVVLWPMTNSWAIIHNPLRASLPAIDVRQYFTGPYAGVGFAEAAQQAQGDEALVLADSWFPLSLSAYLDPTRTQLTALGNAAWAEVMTALDAGRNVYIIDRVLSGNPYADGAVMGLFPRLNGEGPLRVRLVRDAKPESLQTLFWAMFQRPEGLLDQYDALLTQPMPEATWLAPYPPSQLPFVAERWAIAQPAPIQLLDVGGAQPWDAATAIERLAQTDLTGARLRMIFFDEARLDPARRVESWMVTHLFREGEQFFGPLRVVDFAGAGQPVQTLDVGARFGEAIVLETVEILNETAQPNGVVRVRLTWRCEAPVAETLKVFAHLFADANIAAQHDGQPVGELRPTRTWSAGETIADQFAIRVPADVASGAYQLRIGLYNADTQARWPAQLADGRSAEFFVGGVITVK